MSNPYLPDGVDEEELDPIHAPDEEEDPDFYDNSEEF